MLEGQIVSYNRVIQEVHAPSWEQEGFPNSGMLVHWGVKDGNTIAYVVNKEGNIEGIHPHNLKFKD